MKMSHLFLMVHSCMRTYSSGNPGDMLGFVLIIHIFAKIKPPRAPAADACVFARTRARLTTVPRLCLLFVSVT